MTITVYSKPSTDVSGHTDWMIADNGMLLARQVKIAKALQNRPPRVTCLLCDAPLAEAAEFSHRGIGYRKCGRCGHVQCAVLPPDNYPGADQDFAEFYPALEQDAYEARTRTIYAPKAAWALKAARDLGLGDLRQKIWLELGSGAGYFLNALRQEGAKNIAGLEAEKPLAEQAVQALGAPLVRHFSGSLPDAVRRNDAQIYVAWFVLEHCFQLRDFFQALRDKPKGTLFVFAVPTFGFATLLECAVGDHFARNLDGVLHLQLFTDDSIRHAMQDAGYEIGAEWIFGQDSDDLYRLIANGLRGSMPAEMAQRELSRLQAALAEMQPILDQARLADARHILAIKQ